MEQTVPGHPDLSSSSSIALGIARTHDLKLSALPDLACLPRYVSLKRRLEFSLGRLASARALRGLGYKGECSVKRCSNGSPLWPTGIQGSITHAGDCAFSLVAHRSLPGGVGIDFEPIVSEHDKDLILEIFCCSIERAWVNADTDKATLRATQLFGAKEAIYKAFYPALKRVIDPKEVTLSWLPQKAEFEVSCIDPRMHEISELTGIHVRSFFSTHSVFSLYLTENLRERFAKRDLEMIIRRNLG